ncbi:MAG: efflux transporter outer membrane subunit [Alphaproteobacteria bacterium]|nr:efflux transporter outer membrane subunit [Alphaproteobacteria bacterium]MBV9371105.1 efflux transporter outer membrane subunit [Alphaproteobacteria bacterium]MBV9901521.1 efflux transporter outer membrane subunit [Alphaproteobacteria bacterium]
MDVFRKSRLGRAAMLAVLLCSACASVPKLGAPPRLSEAGSLTEGLDLPPTSSGQLWPDAAWWEGYGDAQLSRLIDEALASAPTLEEAAARVRRAEAIAQQAGARLKPSVDAGAQAGAIRVSENIGIPAEILPSGWNDAGSLSIGLSYDLDLWGKNKATLHAAMSDADAARADAGAARLALSTGIASTYAELVRLHAVKDAAETNLRIRTDGERLIQARRTAGLENDAASARAQAGRSAAAADLAAVDEQIELVRNQIAALIGTGPARGKAIALPDAPRLRSFGLPDDLGVEMVGRRPDIVAARLRTEALGSRIKAAKADFYPNVRLSALIGLGSLGLGNLLGSGSAFGSAGPAVSLPIFSGGRLQGAYRGARADYDGSVATYNETLLQAVREIADVGARQRGLAARLTQTRAAFAASQRAYDLIRARYRGGLAPYFEVLGAEDALNANRRAVADLEASAFALDVALVRALGGGFRETRPEGTRS